MNWSSSAKLGWIILRATYFSKPAMPLVLAKWISAMPPTAICLTSRYGPNWRSATLHVLVDGVRRRPLLQHLRPARMHEHTDQTQRRLRATIERADNFGGDSVRHVDDVGRRRIRDEIEPKSRAIGLAIDLVA